MVTDIVCRNAKELSRRAFVEQYRECFLVYGVGREQARTSDFKTGCYPPVAPRKQLAATVRVGTITASGPIATAVTATTAPDRSSPEQSGVLIVAKSQRNPYSDRISIGRAASCDLVLPVLHVSKLHAHFLRAPMGGWEVRDAGSTNGTWVNETRAEPGQRVPVKPGDRLRLAFCDAHFVDAAGLFDLLRKR